MTTQKALFKPELLAPAGNFEKFETALLYGANAVYLGGQTFNLRASCDGFSHEELCKAVAMANAKNTQIFFTLNALPMQKDLAGLPHIIEQAALAGVHGFIIADPGVFMMAKRYAPHIPVHLSTQANTTNSEALAFWVEQGITRANLARELSCKDIYALRKAIPSIELEVFVHGAMCLAVSGQCLLSAWLNKRPANLGRCTHPCRFEYKTLGANATASGCASCHTPDSFVTVGEKTRPDAPLWTVHQGEEYSSFWAPLDLCLIRYLPWFITNGINSIKIEGRMKGASYVAHVVDSYRVALDTAYSIATGQSAQPYDVSPFMSDLINTATRPLGSGFFIPNERINFSEQFISTGNYAPKALLARAIEPLNGSDTKWIVALRGSWKAEMPIEIMVPGGKRVVLQASDYALENFKGEKITVVNSGLNAILCTQQQVLQPGIFIRHAG